MKHPKSYDSSPETRRRMANVKLKNGACEKALAKALWHEGVRYRLNYKALPGSPDIAITKYRIAVFVDGEFWHGYKWEERRNRIKSNKEYWIEKIEENIERDKRNNDQLLRLGWYTLRFWSKDITKDLPGCVQSVMSTIDMLK